MKEMRLTIMPKCPLSARLLSSLRILSGAFFCMMACVPLRAQVFGGNPPSLKWYQLNNDTVRVIFPEGMQAQARQVFSTVMYLNENARTSIGPAQRKADIVLQNQGTFSNGYVALAPFRSEFEITPPASSFSLGSTNWLYQLSLHEYRHVLQNMNFRSGLGRTFHTLFGDYGQSFITNSLIPDWFWEGEAVFMETALSKQGRGRLPGFLDGFESLYRYGKQYGYAKIRNGSLKDRMPDHYPLGYLMVSYGREQYGTDFWKTITHEALLDHRYLRRENSHSSAAPFHWLQYDPYPLSAALKHATGTSIPGFYKKALHYYQQKWLATDTLAAAENEWHLRPSSSVTDYQYPCYLPDHRVLTLKSAYNHAAEIVAIDSAGREEKIVSPGAMDDAYFSYAGHYLAWAELRYDPRWGWKNYSVIRTFDLRTHRLRTITHKSRYFAPDISPDGEKIIAQEVTTNQQYQLALLDAASGKIIRALPNPHRWFYTFPKFYRGDQSVLSAVRNPEGEMAVVSQDIASGVTEVLTPFAHAILGMPVAVNDWIVFPASYGGTSVAMYALDTHSKQIHQLTRPPGNDEAATVDTALGALTFSTYAPSGYTLKTKRFDPAAGKQIPVDSLRKVWPSYVPGALAQEGGPVEGKIPLREEDVSRYHALQHLLKVHSWTLFPNYPETGFFLESQDVLNTMQASLGGGYNFDEASPFVRLQAIYGGLFPVLQLSATQWFHRQGYASDQHKVFWNESAFSAGASIPLNLSANRYTRLLTLGSSISLDHLHYLPGQSLKSDHGQVQYITPYLQFSNAILSAPQEIYPRFAQSLSLTYNHTFGGHYAEQFSGRFDLFLPGLVRNHSFYVDADFAKRDNRRNYLFSDNFVYARGYNAVPFSRIYRLGLNYQLPLCYPDVGLNWAYLLRIRLHLFGDYSQATLRPGIVSPGTYRSAGAALYFDTKWFNYLTLPIGVRYSRLLDRDYEEPARTSRLELLLQLQLY